jgi:hypothetical protein
MCLPDSATLSIFLKAKIQATNAALEADLDLLATKGEAAAAEAEALALEEDGNRSQDLEGELPYFCFCCLCFGTFLSGCTCGARITPPVMSSRL